MAKHTWGSPRHQLYLKSETPAPNRASRHSWPCPSALRCPTRRSAEDLRPYTVRTFARYVKPDRSCKAPERTATHLQTRSNHGLAVPHNQIRRLCPEDACSIPLDSEYESLAVCIEPLWS